MFSVATRTRSNPDVRLHFQPPGQQIPGKLLVSFDRLRDSVKLSYKEQSDEFRLRQRAAKFVSKKVLPTTQISLLAVDRVMKTETGIPVIRVACTDLVARELQFRVFILLRRLKEEGETSTRLEVSSRSREQGQLPNTRAGSGSTTSTPSRGGGSKSTPISTIDTSGVGSASSIASSINTSSSGGGGSAGFPLVEVPAFGLGSMPPSPLPEEIGGSTLDYLELSDMPVQELFPEL